MSAPVSLRLRMCPDITIQEGALFIADAHDCTERSFFFDFLLSIKENPPPQLFLMGDMFDLLVGGITYRVNKYQHYIDLINDISARTELFYFEGNHDFNLTTLFLHVKVIPIEQQPLLCKLPDGSVCLLSHGDRYGGKLHSIYTAWIRNKSVLKILGWIDVFLKGAISTQIEINQRQKNLCKKIGNFEALVEKKLIHYPLRGITHVIEGHYHQGNTFVINGIKYINFTSFACNQSYFSVQSSPETEFAQKQLRGCNG